MQNSLRNEANVELEDKPNDNVMMHWREEQSKWLLSVECWLNGTAAGEQGPSIGFLGLGIMGTAMARNLVKAG